MLTTVSVALHMEEFGNSSDMNYKLYHITYSNGFSFHSSTLQFMNSVNCKMVYILCVHFVLKCSVFTLRPVLLG
jgi:hypothetical protein